jgi:hypothetical protein
MNMNSNDLALFLYQNNNLMHGMYNLLAHNIKNGAIGKTNNSSSFQNSGGNPLLGNSYILPINGLNAES